MAALPDGTVLAGVIGWPHQVLRTRLLVRVDGLAGRIVSQHRARWPQPHGVFADPHSNLLYVSHMYPVNGETPLPVFRHRRFGRDQTIRPPGQVLHLKPLPDDTLAVLLHVRLGDWAMAGFASDLALIGARDSTWRRVFGTDRFALGAMDFAILPTGDSHRIYILGQAGWSSELWAWEADLNQTASPEPLWQVRLGQLFGQRMLVMDDNTVLVQDYDGK